MLFFSDSLRTKDFELRILAEIESNNSRDLADSSFGTSVVSVFSIGDGHMEIPGEIYMSYLHMRQERGL